GIEKSCNLETKSALRTKLENGIEIMYDANEIEIEGMQEINRVNRKKWYGSLIIAFGGFILAPIFSFFRPLAMLMLIVGIIGGAVFWYLKNKQTEQMTSHYTEKIIQIREECEEKTQIPYDYCDWDILNRFQYYVDNYLADTLKECANLYFQEQSTNTIVDRMDDLDSTINRKSDNIESEIKLINTGDTPDSRVPLSL